MKGLIFTYLLTGTGAGLALFNPFYGLLAYVCLAIVKPEYMWPWSVTSGRYSMIVAASMLIGWTYSRRATFLVGKSGAIIGALWAFMAWSVFGAFFAADETEAWKFIDTLAKIVVPLCIGLTTIDSVAKLKQLAWTMALAQGYVAFEMNMSYFSGWNQLGNEGFAGLDNNSAAIALVTGLGLTFFLGMTAERWWQKGLALGLAALMAHAVLFSYSRGGMLAMLMVGAVSFVLIPKQPRHYLMFAAAAIIGISLAGEGVQARFMTMFTKKGEEREESAQSRIDLWRDCWDVMKKSPVMGCGPNQWPLIAEKYGWPRGKEAHSLWMQTGAELGFPGVALLVSFYGLCMYRCWKLTRKRTEVPDPWLRDAARMVTAALVGFIVSAQFVSLESLEIPYYVVLLGCGTLKLSTIPMRSRWVSALGQNESEAPERITPELAMSGA